MGATDQRSVGYVVNAFPVVSETFLVNEIRAIEAKGIPATILALSHRSDRIWPSGTEEIRASVIRCPESLTRGWVVYLMAHLRTSITRPISYLRLLENDAIKPLLRFLRLGPRSPAARNLRKRWRLFLISPVFARRAQRAGVGHLHAHYAKEPLEVAARMSWLTGLSYSFAVHAKDLYTTPPDRLSRRLAGAKFAITCHPHGDRTLRAAVRAEDHRKIHLLPHGLDQRIFSPTVEPRKKGLIVAAGRLTPKKGFDTLIEACSRLKGRADFECVILGEGRLQRSLERAVEKRGLAGHMKFQGVVPQRELARWFQRAQVAAFPSRVLESGNRDGIPNVLLEAMACGTPIVATPVGSIGDVLENGVNGILVPSDDPKALADSLRRILASPARAARMGARAHSGVEALDFRKSGSRIAKLFRGRLSTVDRSRPSDFQLPVVDATKFAKLAARRLGRKPQIREEVEKAIATSIRPGIQANSGRGDLQQMTERRLWDEVAKAQRATELVRYAQASGVFLNASTPVLDIGCGRGGVSVALGARGIPVASLDLRLRNCDVSRLRGRRYELSVPVVNARAESLPFDDEVFEVVCLLEVLEHVADPARLLSEARRVCRPSGLCIVTVVNRWAHLDPHYHLWGINFLPRALAEQVLSLLGRAKKSWQDNQRLVDMNYYSYGAFREFAGSVGFDVHDPRRPDGHLALLKHRLARRISLGYNTITLVLEPS